MKEVKVFFGLWLVWAALCLAANVAIVYVIFHFVTKYW